MALYINGRPVNPIVTFLASAVVIAGIIGLGILLLPVIGGLFVIALLIVHRALRRLLPLALRRSFCSDAKASRRNVASPRTTSRGAAPAADGARRT